ncbi:MAG: hypothetical protein V4721_08955 [Bacteroidota bacterium]
MEVNYSSIGLILLVAIVIIIIVIKRNNRDKKDFEKTVNKSETQPEEHKDIDPL